MMYKLGGLGLVGWLMITPVFACRCAQPASVSETVKIVQAVFSGTVIKEGIEGEDRVVILQVKQIWKGPKQRTWTVRMTNSDCAVPMVRGGTYLIYLDQDGRVPPCGRTGEITTVNEDLAVLGQIKIR